MSIKDFFYKKEVVLEDQSKLTSSVESADLIEEIREQNKTFVPDVDFSDPKNFARFGSAKEYYEGSIKRIYEQYPYDGSEAEKLSFYNDSTFLDQWLFDNKYPKSTGYAVFSADGWGSTDTTINDYGKPNNLEYIYSAGGLREASLYQHTGSDTISSGQLKNVFDKGIKHDSDKNRTLNYRMKMDDGLTIQFWMKKDEFLPSSTKREVILDLWNGVTTSGSHDYGRLILEMSASDKQESALRLTLYSGSYGIVDQPIALSSYGSASIANGEWQHHTITVKAASQNLEINYYNNGILNSGSTYGTSNTLGEIPNNINGYLGALQTASYGDDYHNQDMVGAGKLSASLDDFRYWKKELDAQYIKNTWFYPIGGGSNSDDNRTSLGVYYKFNEGMVGNTAYDATVLDYSGRIANGTWTGYTTSSRNTGSAYVSASILQSEPGDPIIRLDHPSVQSLLTEMATSGSNHDRDNTIRMYDMVPAWLREEDTNGNINYLFQILSSYFDTLYCQIKEVPKLKDKNYFDSGNMPYEFIDRMLSEKGLLVPNTFVSSEILNTFWQRDNQNNYFEQSIEKTKRQIYYNIYNNLEFILKSKGTEKSFRNLLRCFGIDDEVIKLNVYTDNATHYLKDRYKNSSVKSKFVNFNKPSRFGASITQTSSSINSLTFISGSDTARLERNNAFTIEGDVLFPEPRKVEDNDYFVASFISSSIFGFHEANSSDSTDYTFGGSNDANLQFYAVKEEVGSTSAKFVVKNADDSIVVESDLFEEVYTNERWNFSLTVEPVGYPFAGSFLSSSNPDYNIRLYGVTYNNEEIKNEFTLTASVSNTIGNSLLTKPKRLYVGANKTNFTGSTIASTDVKIGSIRMWMDKLSNEAIQQHNLDPKNYGHNKIYGSPTVFFHDISGSSQIPAMDSLILHWNFDENASSDASGEFIVEDFSSGSTSNLYGWASNIIERENKGLGLDFPASEEVFTNEFIFARRKELPEISFTDDRITIMDDEKEFFIEDEDTTDNIFSLEKSMNQSISEEMIRTFSTMKEYANLFAKPVDYYRQEYKRLRKARSLFFERTTGNPDFDKFTEYFKWIDTSVSFFIEQLKPASVTFNEGIANVVESHIFERPKNERKFPTVKTLQSTMGSLRGIGELDYNWKFGHAPDYKAPLSGQEIQFTVNASSSLSDGDLLFLSGTVEGSTVDRQIEIDEAHAIRTAATASVPGETGTDILLTTYRKAIKTVATNSSIVTSNPFSGIGSNDFSISFWVNNITGDNAANTEIRFNNGSNLRHRVDFVFGNTRVYLVDDSGNSDFAIFSTDLHDSNRNTWCHYVITFPVTDLASSVPKLFLNGSELSQAAYTAIGGVTPTIDNFVIEFDDNYAFQDITIWNTLLTGSEAVSELYNSGVWKNPTTHTSASAIIDYYKLGEENYWHNLGYRIGNSLDDIGGSITRTISSSYGTGENDLSISAAGGQQLEFIQGVGEKSSTEIWNNLSSSLSSSFTDWTTSYVDNGTYSTFTLRKNVDDATVINSSKSGTSFGILEITDGVSENIHCLWKKEREVREDIANRETIRKILGSKTSGIIKRLGDPTTDPQTAYIAQGYAEATRRFSKPYKLTAEASTTIHGGTNYNENRNRDFIFDNIKPHGSKTSTGIPVNVVVVGVGPGQGIINSSVCDDVEDPNKKEKYNFRMTVGKDSSGDGSQPSTGSLDLVYEVKSAYGSPFNIVSGNVDDGTNRTVDQNYKDNVILTNLHSDTTYVSNDIPMQGPFTETWVGGRQNRHVQLNKYNEDYTTTNKLDDQYTRPEAYRILFGEHPDESVQDGALGIVGPDYGGPYPDTTRKWAIYYRDLRGKRPYNIQNIQGDQYRQGNYTEKYEYFNSVGRLENNSRFKKAGSETDYELSGTFLPTQIRQDLPETTNPMTLVGQEPGQNGNVFGSYTNNRQPNNITVEKESDFLTGSIRNRTVIASRFSAPGGVEVQTYGYLDAYAHEYSVHNNLNYRNLSIRGSGSGESGTIRVNSHANTRDGLRTLYQRPMGRGGVDSVYEQVDETDYNLTASFHKVPRNTLVRPKSSPTKAVNLSGSSALTQESKLINYNLTGYSSSGAVSFSGWMKVNSFNGHLFAFQDSATNYPSNISYLAYNALSGIYIFMYSTTGLMNFYSWNNADLGVTNDYWLDWHHYVISWNGNLSSAPILYLNGQTGVTANSVVVNGGTRKDFDKIQIGSDQQLPYYVNNNANYQDFVFFSSTINLAQAQELYNDGKHFDVTKHSLKANIIDYWNLTNEYQDIVEAGESFGENLEFNPKIGSNILSSVGKIYEEDPIQGSFVISTKNLKNNLNYQSTIPASDYNYSWVTSSLGNNYNVRSGTQKVFGYWPKDGLNKVNGIVDTAIIFPTASDIIGV